MSDLTPLPPAEPTRPIDTAEPVPVSPRWGVFTKFLVSMILVVITGSLLVRFHQMIAPLAMAVILAYLLKPAVQNLTARTRLRWGVAAGLLYLFLLLLLLSLLTVAGFAIAQQLQGLYSYVLEITKDLPTQLQTVVSQPLHLGPLGVIDLTQPFKIGPFGPFGPLNLETNNWQPLYDQLIAAVQPALSRTSGIISSLATGTAETLGWALFIFIISFYILTDMRNIAVSIENLVPEGYAYDVRRLMSELGPVWNAFLRGQLTLAIVMGFLVGLMWTVLGLRYSAVLGLLAGLLEFIPILGPVTAGTAAVLVALFQGGNWLGLSPLPYAAVVLVAAILLQQVENNFLVPRIIGGSLNLHPVIILIGAVIAANLAGIIGLLLSAPILATLRLFGRYIYRKMFDLEPWPEPPARLRAPAELKWARWMRRRLSSLWAERERLSRP